ncbi:hypothetical protein ACRALDRAFT_2075713, partial [Sodiomyces alcalophilus JCM 7366]|uniref:uncharacterized protein n=1 Tax=Sodiomyces alcalophilus JCM 7366 TaxID=591952 RepID=UPI0039B57F7D
MAVDDVPMDEGPAAPHHSYNFAPGYHGAVYRAVTPAYSAGLRDQHVENVTGTNPQSHGQDIDTTTPGPEASAEARCITYKIQSMTWGIVPAWPKRHPKYSKTMKIINCRDDSLSSPHGMWAPLKTRQRCIVVAQGFYEWLKTGRDKVPYFVKRKDGRLMYFAGLWNSVQCDDPHQQVFSYTIITTGSNDQLKFLHDRMPVILDGGCKEVRAWLDPTTREWSRDLQTLLKPYSGDLECYPVSKEVGKVGNDSPSFVLPVYRKENRSDIANFFSK